MYLTCYCYGLTTLQQCFCPNVLLLTVKLNLTAGSMSLTGNCNGLTAGNCNGLTAGEITLTEAEARKFQYFNRFPTSLLLLLQVLSIYDLI